ncbi:MAG: TonB-dependent receptor, partial [Bacteroidia bacterium]|nr:TonB-dependent receptor [Bacteroidia bacterium]
MTRSILFFVFLFPLLLLSQSTVTLSGYVRDAESGETLIGAAVALPELKQGTFTNEYGYFSLSLPQRSDSIEVVYSYAGYTRQSTMVLPQADMVLKIEMAYQSLNEVVISANSVSEQVNSSQMSVTRVSMKEAKALPAFMGEVDIIKTLQLKPGVSTGSEGSSGIFVRGGGPDQNLVLLDNTVLYNPSHLFGFFSTFNSDAVKDVQLYKGGFPAQYGGRLSSVIDVKMNEGNRKKFAGTGGLGLISSRLTLEGPIVKDKASFVVSGRRTYVDIITSAINESQKDNPNFLQIPDYFFYDFNAKVNYEISPKDQIFLSGYIGRDRFKFDDSDFNFNFDWGNTNATLRWNHLFSQNLFMNVSAFFTDYQYKIQNQFDLFSFELGSQITDWGSRVDFSWTPTNNHSVKFGASGIYHTFIVGRLNAGSSDSTFSFDAGDKYFGTELGAYISDDWEVNSRLTLNFGLRVSGFVSDSTTYWNLEPRFASKFTLAPNVALKLSYARMAQYLHLVANSGTSLPTDVWYPSTANVKPQLSDQVALGITFGLGEKYLVSNELYYKWLHNQIDFRDGANLFVNDDLESEFVFGNGFAYGNEFYIEKLQGKLTGWIGYTLGWSWRRFDGTYRTGEYIEEDAINEGRKFHPRNDSRHTVTVVGIYEINKRFSASAAWTYLSGTLTTPPLGAAWNLGPGGGSPTLIPIFGDRNSLRVAPYHRLDLGFVIRFFPKWGESDLTISAYNAYNRRNVYFLRFS